jgi:hypothetical protein
MIPKEVSENYAQRRKEIIVEAAAANPTGTTEATGCEAI